MFNATKRIIAERDEEIERLRAALKGSESIKRGYIDEVERLRSVLDAARICFKNRDQSSHEVRVYAAICAALDEGLPTAEDVKGILKPAALEGE